MWFVNFVRDIVGSRRVGGGDIRARHAIVWKDWTAWIPRLGVDTQTCGARAASARIHRSFQLFVELGTFSCDQHDTVLVLLCVAHIVWMLFVVCVQVSSAICQEELLKDRVRVYEKFVNLMCSLRTLQNFSAIMAIISGFVDSFKRKKKSFTFFCF